MTPTEADRFVEQLEGMTTRQLTLLWQFLYLYTHRRLDVEYGRAKPLSAHWWATGPAPATGARKE